jgi:hypothetical protein
VNIYYQPEAQGVDLLADVTAWDDHYTYAFAAWNLGDRIAYATDTVQMGEDRGLFDWADLDYGEGLIFTVGRAVALTYLNAWANAFDHRFVDKVALRMAREAIADWRPDLDFAWTTKGVSDCE